MRILMGFTLVLAFAIPRHAAAQDISATGSVPRIITVSGTYEPAFGQPAGVRAVITLAVYAQATGGTALFEETQEISLGANGRYAAEFGATQREGLPATIFADGSERWLGVRFAGAGEVEGPRKRLTSVPYALRAADAETLGGHPASAYVLSPTPAGDSRLKDPDGVATTAAQDVLPGTPNALAKYVSGADVGSSAVVEANGLVGIGTTTPLDALHVRFTNTNGGLTGLAMQNLGNSATSYSGTLFYDQTGALSQCQGFNNFTHEYRINNIAKNNGSFDGSINFMIGGTSRFFVGSNGQIGIGTTKPQLFTSLEVMRNTEAIVAITGVNSSTNPSLFIGRRAHGTPDAPSAVVTGDALAMFAGGGFNGFGFTYDNGGTGVVAMEDWTPTAQGTALVLRTTALGTSFSRTVLGILPNGNVGIGTPQTGTGGPTATDKLQVFGDVRVGTSGTNGCLMNFAGSGIAGTCASDRRYKKGITAFSPVLDRVSALQPVHFYWRTDEFPEHHFGAAMAYGLIAQDVERVLPELVVTQDGGYKAVDYSELPLLAIQAIKELKAQNDDLRKRVEDLERFIGQIRPSGGGR